MANQPSLAPAAVNDAPLPLNNQSDDGPRSRVRWGVLVLVFLGTTVNYVDRQVMGFLGPHLRELYNISKPAYGDIQATFAIAYALGQMVSGGVLDKIGTRAGYAIALFGWSLASMLHAFAIGIGGALTGAFAAVTGIAIAAPVLGFAVVRGVLGVTESPAFPAATKTLAEWFPKRERALAMGIVNGGANVGILIAAASVGVLTKNFGWQWTFLLTGALGFVVLAVWIPFYRRPHEHPRVSKGELAYIHSDPAEPTAKIPWITLLGYRQTWAWVLAKFLTDAMWWFYVVWFAQFFKDRYGLELLAIGVPLFVIYVIADVGSVGGGWLSSAMLKRGASVNAARKTALLVCALCVTPIVFAAYPSNYWISVLLLGIATAGHQGFSSNIYTVVSDTFPRRAVASVAGLGGTAGYIGATIFASLTGRILQWTNDQYMILFIIAGSAYLVALGIIHLLMPRLEPAAIGDDPGTFTVAPPPAR